MHRTAKIIPGAFVLTFWDTLLLQASLKEPAVLNALLALSSVHKKQITNDSDTTDDQEQFMLRHYIKAIRNLQSLLMTEDKGSVRVPLITCVVFTCLEFLLGHFATAQVHLHNGLKVLKETHFLSNMNEDTDGILTETSSLDSLDHWIVEAFLRLYVQVELFKQSYQHQCLIVQTPSPGCSTLSFRSTNEAWQQLEQLLNRIFHLTERNSRYRSFENLSAGNTSGLLECQQHVQAELARWLGIYERSSGYLRTQNSGGIACQVLRTYHAMISIMAGTCLRSDDESMFDSYTSQFIFIIDESVSMWKLKKLGSEVGAMPGQCKNVSRSIVDIGWISPLYYTALKCRVHRVRLHAIRLLESTSRREAIWDAKVSSCVARKVMEIEEAGFYGNLNATHIFSLCSSPGLQDLSLPTLPESHRLHEVEVVLPNSSTDSISLVCRQKQSNGYMAVLTEKYHPSSQCWTDKRTGEETRI